MVWTLGDLETNSGILEVKSGDRGWGLETWELNLHTLRWTQESCRWILETWRWTLETWR